LADISRGASHNLLKELTSLFETHTPGLIAELEKAITAKQNEMIKRIAHRIKGSAMQLGALRMSRICEQIENKALTQIKSGDTLLDSHVEELRKTYDQTVVDLNEMPNDSKMAA
jgi:HPt (histidine-containing phosphotransfer) domain-containing protein